jgi:hypothetical protein
MVRSKIFNSVSISRGRELTALRAYCLQSRTFVPLHHVICWFDHRHRLNFSKGLGIGQHRGQRQRDIRLLCLQFSEFGVSPGEFRGAISQSAVSLIVAQYRAIHS